MAESKEQPKLGRPRSTAQDHRLAMWCVARELRKQAYPGWRPIAQALNQKISTRLVQHYVSRFKTKRRLRCEQRKERDRIRIEVTAKNALWTQDATHVGRLGKKAVESQVIKDRGSLKTVRIETGSGFTGADIVRALETAKKSRGLPLVWMTDNGSTYCDERVSEYLRQEKVIHLRSLPRTPQHNGAAEIAIKEIKHEAMLGKGVSLSNIGDAHARMIRAAIRINENRLRSTKGFKTAQQLDETLPASYNFTREQFYTECCLRMNEAVLGERSKRAVRLAEREAVISTLEQFGLVRRNRGGRSYAAEKAENIL